MRVTQRIAGLAVLVALSTYGCELQTSAREVQLRSLVQRPQQYEEKVVVVHGFLSLGREGDAICSDIPDVAKGFCVEIERSDKFLKQRDEHYSALQGHRVSFVAKFVAVPKDHQEPPCPAGQECILIDLAPPFRLRVTSTINVLSR